LDAGNDETLGRLSWPGVQKAPMHEVAGSWHPAVQRVLWGSYVGGDGGRGASRMLPQLSRFGMNVAKEYF
jgi:hypothetical protein